MDLDLVFIAMLVVFILRGWYRGYIRGLASTVGFVIGYGLAYLSCRPAGSCIVRTWPVVPLPLAIGVGGFAVFTLVSAVAGLVGWPVYRRRLTGLSDENRDAFVTADRDNGATLGLVQGLLFIFFLCLVLSLVPAGNPIDRALGVQDSAFVDWVRPVAPALLGQLVAEATGSAATAGVVAAVVRDPTSAQRAAQRVMGSPTVQNLASDRSFLEHVATGDPAEVARDPRLEAIMRDPEVLAALAELGLSGDDVQVTPEQTAQAVVQVRRVMDDMQRLARQAVEQGRLPAELDTPELRQAMQDGRLQDVLRQPGALRTIFTTLLQPHGPTEDSAPEGMR